MASARSNLGTGKQSLSAAHQGVTTARESISSDRQNIVADRQAIGTDRQDLRTDRSDLRSAGVATGQGLNASVPGKSTLTATALANNAANQSKTQQTQTTHQAWYHYFIW